MTMNFQRLPRAARPAFVAGALACALGQALAQTAAPAVAASAAAPAQRPYAELPYTPGLDLKSMDLTAKPCEDFYQYTCGGWLKNNPIPADKSRWDVYAKLAQDNRQFLWGILEQLAAKPEGRSVAQQKIGDHFAACMDEGAVNALGAKPLQPLLAKIDGLTSKKALPVLLAELHRVTGDDLFFGFSANQDFGDSTRVIAFTNSGGLSLPDRDYYLKDDEKSKTLREGYRAHVERMLGLLGDSPEAARDAARVVIEIETALARDTLSRVDQRDPQKLYHRSTVAGLQKLTPGFAWAPYLAAQGLGKVSTVNITEPAFIKAVNQLLLTRSLADIKTYLRWHVLHGQAAFLSKPFVDESFAYFSKTLRGTPEQSPRWQRCVSLVDRQLGDALGQEYVRVAFSPELKAKTQKMTRQIEDAMATEIQGLDWMSAATKKKAMEKLHGIVNKVGYPDRWRDYGPIDVRRDDFLGNVLRAAEFEQKRQYAKIGKPVNRGEWGMTPPTVNAYYDAQMNDINFPAGVLQPPLFDARMDDAPNYGNTGGTIGHELTHGFDDEGRQFDARGNLKNWWAPADEKAFNERTQCLVDQYAQYVVVDDIHINSKLTLGEDLADLGGLVIAMMAWKGEVAKQTLPQRDGFTPDQRFFIGMAQWACEAIRPEEARIHALTDPHSPGKYRVNGLVANFKEFEQAFHCTPGQPMAPVKRCKIW